MRTWADCAFRRRSGKKHVDDLDGQTVQAQDEGLTPNDAIAAIVSEGEQALTTDLLDRVSGKPPKFLERLAPTLLQAMGYGGRDGVLEHTGGSGDKGLDGVIRQDALGLDRIGVQAKR